MTSVTVRTGARLHFGLICAEEGQPERFGGCGLMISEPGWHLEIIPSDSGADEIEFALSDRDPKIGSADFASEGTRTDPQHAADIRERLLSVSQALPAAADRRSGYCFRVRRLIPRHCGFGAGTQLALAAASGIDVLRNGSRMQSVESTAEHLGRRRRSAVGTAGFRRGGFVLDRGIGATVGERCQHAEIPPDWRFVIIRPNTGSGLSGAGEETFFRSNPCIPAAESEELMRLLSESVFPAAAAGEFRRFRDALGTYGTTIGRFFADSQGAVCSSSLMESLRGWLIEHGYPWMVQSSWGPACCLPAEDAGESDRIISLIRRFRQADALIISSTSAMPAGCTVSTAAPEVVSNRRKI